MLDFLIFAVTVVVFLLFAVIYLYPGSKRSTTIPGPEPVDDLEGNTPDIVACGGLHYFLLKLHQDYGPIVAFWMGPEMWVSIAKANLFQQHSSVFDRACSLFSSVLPLLGDDSIQVTNGVDGRRRHAMYSKFFTSSFIKSYMSVYNELADDAVKKWRTWTKDEYIPVRDQCLNYTIRTFLRVVYNSAPDDDHVKRLRASYDVCMNECDQQFKGNYPEAGGARLKRFEKCKEEIHQVVRDVISREKEDVSSNASNNMVAAALSLGLPESTVCSDLVTFFLGGFHTTASLLTWLLYYLALYPEVQKRVRDEVLKVAGDVKELTYDHIDDLKYLHQVVNETLRITVGGPFASRQQDVETVIGGHVIPAGTPVIHALGVSLQDPEVYPEPDKFDPERFSPENMSKLPEFAFKPFGFAGKRQCPGYRFSLAEAMSLVAVLLRSDSQLVLAPDQTVVPKITMVSFPAEEIWLTVEKIPKSI